MVFPNFQIFFHIAASIAGYAVIILTSFCCCGRGRDVEILAKKSKYTLSLYKNIVNFSEPRIILNFSYFTVSNCFELALRLNNDLPKNVYFFIFRKYFHKISASVFL